MEDKIKSLESKIDILLDTMPKKTLWYHKKIYYGNIDEFIHSVSRKISELQCNGVDDDEYRIFRDVERRAHSYKQFYQNCPREYMDVFNYFYYNYLCAYDYDYRRKSIYPVIG